MEDNIKKLLELESVITSVRKLFTEKTTGLITRELKSNVLTFIKGFDLLKNPTDIEVVFNAEEGLYQIILKV
jgi:hypothetical protein